jgi:transposase-like protein
MWADMKNPEPCPRCQSVKVVKNGTRSGRQRFACHNCNHYFFVDEASRPQRYSSDMKALCLRLYLNKRLNLREIEQLTNVDHTTIFNWVKQANTPLPVISPLSTKVPEFDS